MLWISPPVQYRCFMKVQSVCAHCGKSFSMYPSVAKRREEHTCSLSCARARWPNKKRAGTTKKCETCAADFYVPQNRASTARFCSDSCKNAFQRGANHPSWTGGEDRPWAWRQAIIDKMKTIKSCQICGSTAHLCGHHIHPTSTHPELGAESTNILILCTLCHSKQHPKLEALILSKS